MTKNNEEKERYESELMWFLTKIEAFVFLRTKEGG